MRSTSAAAVRGSTSSTTLPIRASRSRRTASPSAISPVPASQTREKPVESGFLSDYSKLEPGGDDRAQLVYIKPGLSVSAYRAVYVEPVKLHAATTDSDLAELFSLFVFATLSLFLGMVDLKASAGTGADEFVDRGHEPSVERDAEDEAADTRRYLGHTFRRVA